MVIKDKEFKILGDHEVQLKITTKYTTVINIFRNQH